MFASKKLFETMRECVYASMASIFFLLSFSLHPKHAGVGGGGDWELKSSTFLLVHDNIQ